VSLAFLAVAAQCNLSRVRQTERSPGTVQLVCSERRRRAVAGSAKARHRILCILVSVHLPCTRRVANVS
jgi:hypothetical protein